MIPKGWEYKKIKDVGEVTSGGTPDTTNTEYWDGDINWCTPTDITALNGHKYLGETVKKITDFGLKNSSAKLLPPNSIIVCTRATIGKAAINTVPMSTNQGFKNIVPKTVDNNFLYYKILSEEAGLIKIASGSTFLEVSKTDFDNYEILIPTLNEQIKIAEILSTCDVAIEKQLMLIDSKEKQKKGLMQNLLTGKVRFKGFEEDEWIETTVGEISKFENGKGHENSITEDGSFVVVNSKFVASEGREYKRSNECLVPLRKSDIVMVMSDVPNGKALAKCFLIDENNKYTLNQRICKLTVNKDNNECFIYYLINRNEFYLQFDSGVGQTNLRKAEVLACPLFIPKNAKEQQKIAEVISEASKEINLLKRELENIRLLKRGLMQQLLTGKILLK